MRTVSVLLATCFMVVPLGATPIAGRAVPTKPTAAPSNDSVSRALDFLGSLDENRMFEKAYANRVLQEADIVRASDRYEGDIRTATEMARLVALWATDRNKEAFAAADALLARGVPVPEIYTLAFEFAGRSDPQKAVDYLESASENLATPEQRATFKDSLDDETVSAVGQTLTIAKDKVARARLAEGLLKFGWPGDHQFARQDGLRMTALKGRLAKGDVAGARALARQIADPSTGLELLVAKAYDPVTDAGDRVARLTALIEAEDQRSAKALRAKPGDLKLILARGQFLRSVGREREALALLLPSNSDMAAIEKGGNDAFWVVNETAYALSALGRTDDAIGLMRRLLALGLDKHPDLISMAINSAGIMSRAGRYRQAATYAEDLFRNHADKASKYGQMWMWEVAACGHAMGDNITAAKPWVARLRADPDANRAALMGGLLCANDLDGAAAQLVERLDGDDVSDMLVAVQNYTIPLTGSASALLLDQRLRDVVARPAVAAAIASKGRILKLPLSRTYWGMF